MLTLLFEVVDLSGGKGKYNHNVVATLKTGRSGCQQSLDFESSSLSKSKRKSGEPIVLDGSDEDRKPAAIVPKKPRNSGGVQLKLTNNKPDPRTEAKMDVAIADFVHSNLLPFSIAQCPKFQAIQV